MKNNGHDFSSMKPRDIFKSLAKKDSERYINIEEDSGFFTLGLEDEFRFRIERRIKYGVEEAARKYKLPKAVLIRLIFMKGIKAASEEGLLESD